MIFLDLSFSTVTRVLCMYFSKLPLSAVLYSLPIAVTALWIFDL